MDIGRRRDLNRQKEDGKFFLLGMWINGVFRENKKSRGKKIHD